MSKKWQITQRNSSFSTPEISVTYGGKSKSHGWPDVDKIIMPEPNPGTPEQVDYFRRVAGIIAEALNNAGVEPYYSPEDMEQKASEG